MVLETPEILADRTGIHPRLEKIFKYNYPRSLRRGKASDVIPLPPLTFHDRHIGPTLILKSVKSLGFPLARYLCELCDDEIMSFVRKEGPLRTGKHFVDPGHGNTFLGDGFEVAEYYSDNFGSFTPTFPSKFYFLPKRTDWSTLLYVQYPRSKRIEDGFKVETGLTILDWVSHKSTLKQLGVDEDMMREVQVVGTKHPNIAVYEMFAFSPSAAKLIHKMGPIPQFKWYTSQTLGSFANESSHQEFPPDAKTDLWSKIAPPFPPKPLVRSKPQLSKKSPATPKTFSRVTRGNGVVRDPGRRGLRARAYHPEPKHYLQHAWCRAVENDATFIIFQCGKYERVGFRHRETQTLYLSELIDPSVLPMYGKMEIGLQLAIVKDLLERRAASKKDEQELSRSDKKRPRAANETDGSNKRQRREKGSEGTTASAEVVESGLGSRDLALFRLEYRSFNSTVPSSFIRVEPSCASFMKDRAIPQEIKGRKKYGPSEYFTLTLDEPFATGAIGTVHRASAKFEFDSTIIEHPGLAVKFAFHEEHQERLRNEYKVYQHMASVGYTANILRVHGLFQDLETGLLAMVMDYGGPTLGTKGLRRGNKSFTKQEQKALRDALDGLHKANVLHGDIKNNNIVVDSSDNVCFVDFDCAEIDPHPDSFEEEQDTLSVILGLEE